MKAPSIVVRDPRLYTHYKLDRRDTLLNFKLTISGSSVIAIIFITTPTGLNTNKNCLYMYSCIRLYQFPGAVNNRNKESKCKILNFVLYRYNKRLMKIIQNNV